MQLQPGDELVLTAGGTLVIRDERVYVDGSGYAAHMFSRHFRAKSWTSKGRMFR